METSEATEEGKIVGRKRERESESDKERDGEGNQTESFPFNHLHLKLLSHQKKGTFQKVGKNFFFCQKTFQVRKLKMHFEREDFGGTFSF